MAGAYAHQATRATGRTVEIALLDADGRPGPCERHSFGSAKQAAERAAVIVESLSWIGTPFRDCADVKGPDGAVDCAMKLCHVYGDTGVVPFHDPRPYSPRWFMHQEEERFLDCLRQLGAVEVPAPRVGDIGVWRFGRTYAHGAVIINSAEVCHAYAADGMVTVTRLDQPLLSAIPWVAPSDIPRPVKFFSPWGA